MGSDESKKGKQLKCFKLVDYLTNNYQSTQNKNYVYFQLGLFLSNS